MHRRAVALFCCAACLVVPLSVAAADSILSPTAVLQNTGGDFSSSYDIGQTIDQSGLSAGFVSGVTDFDAYLATNPLHTFIAADFEWFAPDGVGASTIIYDLGAEYDVTRLALWNEEAGGISRFTAQGSNDPTFGSFTALGAFIPADSPFDTDYPAEVFDLVDASYRYVRLEVVGPNSPSIYDGVSMGEIAFAVNSTAPVPEPGVLSLLAGSGLAGFGVALRRLRRK